MFRQANRQPKQRSWRQQCVEMLCCLLGLIWVGNPSFHSFSHLVDFPHQHPSGSTFSHDLDATSNKESSFYDSLLASTDDGQTHASWSSLPWSTVHAEPTPESSDEPGDNDDAPVFYVLEIEASVSETYVVSTAEDLLVIDDLCFESIGFSSLQELGTVSPRGPPVA